MAEDSSGQDDDRGGGTDSPAPTRDRILTALRDLIVEEGYDGLSLERVADRAGVARATIYYQFRSKAGLLDALIRTIEVDADVPLTRQRDETFSHLVARVSQLWEPNRDVIRNVLAAIGTDANTRDVVNAHDLGRHVRVAELVDQLDAEDKLLVDHADATDLLWLLTSFEIYDFLRERTERDPHEVRRLLEILGSAVVADG